MLATGIDSSDLTICTGLTSPAADRDYWRLRACDPSPRPHREGLLKISLSVQTLVKATVARFYVPV